MTWKQKFMLPRKITDVKELKDGNLILIYTERKKIFVGVVDIERTTKGVPYGYWDASGYSASSINNGLLKIELNTDGNLGLDEGKCFIMEDYHDKNIDEFTIDVKELNLK